MNRPTTTTAPLEAGVTSGIMPEFVRVADATKLFGFGKSTIFKLIAAGRIKSHLVRLSGNKSGLRLISTASLRSFIESQPSEIHPSE